MWRNKNITEREGFGGGRKGGGAGASDGKSMTVTNDDAGRSGDGGGRGKVTSVGSHVSGRAGVHEPVTAATVGAGGGGRIGLKNLEKRRVRRWGGVIAGRGIGRRARLRSGEKRLVSARTRAEDAGQRGAR